MRSVVPCVVAMVLGAPLLACGRQLLLGDEATTDLDPSDPTLKESPLPGSGNGAPPSSPADAGPVEGPAPDASSPPKPRVVFVTHTTFTADDIEGLNGADLECNVAASEGVPALKGKRFVAWLSDDVQSAKSRLGGADGPWNRVDGERVADDLAHLLGTEPLAHPIDRDEDGETTTGYAWTGTTRTGTPTYGANCVQWTLPNGSGVVGALVADAAKWTAAKAEDCGGGGKKSEDRPRHHLYCFERDP